MDTFWFVVEAIGTLAFAISGIIEARSRHMDMVGVYAAALLTAFGGGTLRDLMLDGVTPGGRPLFWIEHQWWPVVILGLCMVAWPLFRDPTKATSERKIQLSIDLTDALGLALCAALGASITLRVAPDKGFIAALMAVVSSVFGGVLRDVVCNEIPNVFKRSQLYATAAFLGGALYAGMHAAGIAPHLCFAAAFATTLGLRVAAITFNLRLPV